MRMSGAACVSADYMDVAMEEDDDEDATQRVTEESPCTSPPTIVLTTLTNRPALEPMNPVPQFAHRHSACAIAAAASRASSRPDSSASSLQLGVPSPLSRAAADQDSMSVSTSALPMLCSSNSSFGPAMPKRADQDADVTTKVYPQNDSVDRLSTSASANKHVT